MLWTSMSSIPFSMAVNSSWQPESKHCRHQVLAKHYNYIPPPSRCTYSVAYVNCIRIFKQGNVKATAFALLLGQFISVNVLLELAQSNFNTVGSCRFHVNFLSTNVAYFGWFWVQRVTRRRATTRKVRFVVYPVCFSTIGTNFSTKGCVGIAKASTKSIYTTD